MHVPDPPHPLRPEFASRGQMGDPNGNRRAPVPLSKPWSAPPGGVSRCPMPHPAGTGKATEERLKTRGSLAVCFFVVVGGWVHPTCHPSVHQNHMEKKKQSSILLPFLASPCLACVFLHFLAEVWDWETWGECPQGIWDFRFPWLTGSYVVQVSTQPKYP